MGRADFLRLGDWNATCYECGRKRKASEMKRYWKGYWLCPEHWEPRQPQDFVRGIPDIQTPPWVQDQSDTFIQVCTLQGSSAIPSYAIPHCMTPSQKLLPSEILGPVYTCSVYTGSAIPSYGGPPCMTPAVVVPTL